MLRAKRGASINGDACIREAQGATQLTQSRQIRRETGGNLDVLLRRSGDEFRQAQVGQLRQPGSSDNGLACRRDDGNAHPQ